MGDIEYGKCAICGQEKQLRRTYYRYDIKCECHSPSHFDLVIHCGDCVPERPRETRVIISTDNLSLLAEREAERVQAMEKVVAAARDCANMVLLNTNYDDVLSDETKALVKALADLDALGGGE